MHFLKRLCPAVYSPVFPCCWHHCTVSASSQGTWRYSCRIHALTPHVMPRSEAAAKETVCSGVVDPRIGRSMATMRSVYMYSQARYMCCQAKSTVFEICAIVVFVSARVVASGMLCCGCLRAEGRFRVYPALWSGWPLQACCRVRYAVLCRGFLDCYHSICFHLLRPLFTLVHTVLLNGNAAIHAYIHAAQIHTHTNAHIHTYIWAHRQTDFDIMYLSPLLGMQYVIMCRKVSQPVDRVMCSISTKDALYLYALKNKIKLKKALNIF